MTRVKRKTTMSPTPSPNQRINIPKNTTTNESPNSSAKPHRFLMTAASRRIQVLSKDTVNGRRKAQVQKDTNQKSKSSQTNAKSLGKKSQRGHELPWLELFEPKTLLHIIHADYFPNERIVKDGTSLSSRASRYFHKISVIVEAENESIASAEDSCNLEFVFPDDDVDEDDKDGNSYRDEQVN
ncbi:hypothetical protein ACHAPG_006756 [Botrytis cinerea]